MLAQSGVNRAIVVYNFASRATLARLDGRRVIAWRAPLDPAELVRRCARSQGLADAVPDSDLEGVDLAGPIPVRRYSDEALARFLAQSTTVRCEGPHHLADLVANVAFETYSRECESRSVEDAALHAQLHATTAHCRALIETARRRVIVVEGLEP